MELFIIARFHAREGLQEDVAGALRAVVPPTRAEPGRLALEAFAATRDPRLFHIHSRWMEEVAFEHHATLPHTVLFIERVQTMIDHLLEVVRARPLGMVDGYPDGRCITNFTLTTGAKYRGHNAQQKGPFRHAYLGSLVETSCVETS